jgi:hypothetical protein
MRRREFAALTGMSIAGSNLAAAAPGLTWARASDLLSKTLTPLGAERAGNADGSIPPWTGGLSAPALPATQPIDVQLFTGEAPLQTVHAGNMANFAELLTPGTQALMQKFGFSLKLYQTHRTAAATQFVYDNTALNMARARLDPAGGHMGITGAYGGVPFPVIDTKNPLAGGAQLIWNHLTSWRGIFRHANFVPWFVVVGGQFSLSAAAVSSFIYPYYDPKFASYVCGCGGVGYDGFFSETLVRYAQPSNIAGGRTIIWRSEDLAEKPNQTWNFMPGEFGVRPRHNDEFYYAMFNPAASKIAALDEYMCFDGAPSQYDWRFIGKQEMLVPYNCNVMHFHKAQDVLGPKFPNPDIVRWEKHRVWVVEASLRPGQTNALVRRRLYIDEDSWLALLGEAYDASGKMVKYYSVYNRCIPSLPATCKQGSLVFDLADGNYVYEGSVMFGGNPADEFAAPQNKENYGETDEFEGVQMCSASCF